MMMSRDDITYVLEKQAWERAKGELRCVLASSFPPETGDTKALDRHREFFAKKKALIEEFIKTYEDNF